MDDQTRDNRVLRRLALVAALCASPAVAAANQPESSSTQLHSILRSTNAGSRPSARVVKQDEVWTSDSRPVIIRPRARVLGVPAATVGPVVSEAASVVDQPAPLPRVEPKGLAELIRQSNKVASAKTKIPSAPVSPRLSNRESIRVEFSPQVHRIDLGTYDPTKTGQIESGAVVRFVELMREEEPQTEQGAPVDQSPVPSAVDDTPTTVPTTTEARNLLPALADPELGPMIESSANDEVESEGEGVFSARSRRVADIGGFQLLPLESFGREIEIDRR